MKDSKLYSSNSEGVDYIQRMNRSTKSFLFLLLPFQILCILFAYFRYDGPIRIAVIGLLLALIVLFMYATVIGRGKHLISCIKKVTLDDDALSLETFDSFIYKKRNCNLSNTKTIGAVSHSLYPDLGEIYIIKNEQESYLLIKQFFDEYEEIVSQLKDFPIGR